jgi:hypothetical protein
MLTQASDGSHCSLVCSSPRSPTSSFWGCIFCSLLVCLWIWGAVCCDWAM